MATIFWIGSVIGIIIFISGFSFAFGQSANSTFVQPKSNQHFDILSLLDGALGAGIAAGIAVWYAHYSESRKEKKAKEGMHRVVKSDLALFERALLDIQQMGTITGNFEVSNGTNQWPNLIRSLDAADRFEKVPLDAKVLHFEPKILEDLHDIYGTFKGYRSRAQELARFTKNYELPTYRIAVSDTHNLLKKVRQASLKL